MYLIRSGAAAYFDQLVLEHGHNPVTLMHQAGLPQAQFRDPNTYIAYPRLALLLELAADCCQQPLFGLLLAQRQTLKVLGDLPLLVSGEATVSDALQRANDYLYLHAGGIRLQMDKRGDQAQLALQLNFWSQRGVQQLMQLSVAQLAMFVAALLNNPQRTATLHLRQPPPVTVAKDMPALRFNAGFDGILLPQAQLQSRNHQDEAALQQHLHEHLLYLQQRYPDNLANQVQDIIGRLLPTGECSVARVAMTLGLHPRSLQQRLQQQQLSYRQLLQRVRQSLAEQHLRYPSQSITELALQLGYADIAVFSRHFRQWSGLSPRQWQQKHQQPDC